MSKKSNTDLTITINFADLLDNADLSDRNSEYFNMTAWKSVDSMLTNVFFQKRYNDDRLHTAMSRYDTAYDNAERVYGEDSAMEQADVVKAYEYLALYEARAQHFYDLIDTLGQIYTNITGTQPTSYDDWAAEQAKTPARSAKTVKISDEQKADMQRARKRKAA